MSAQPPTPRRPSRLLGELERTNAAELLDLVAERVADLVAERLAERLPAGGPDPYLDVDGAAAYLACPRSRVYDLVQLGRVVPRRDGRRLLFRPSDLDAALDGERSA